MTKETHTMIAIAKTPSPAANTESPPTSGLSMSLVRTAHVISGVKNAAVLTTDQSPLVLFGPCTISLLSSRKGHKVLSAC